MAWFSSAFQMLLRNSSMFMDPKFLPLSHSVCWNSSSVKEYIDDCLPSDENGWFLFPCCSACWSSGDSTSPCELSISVSGTTIFDCSCSCSFFVFCFSCNETQQTNPCSFVNTQKVKKPKHIYPTIYAFSRISWLKIKRDTLFCLFFACKIFETNDKEIRSVRTPNRCNLRLIK